MTLQLEDLRAREFARLDQGGHAYLDYTGGGLHPESLVASHMDLLRRAVLGNPHSQNPPSLESTGYVEEARAEILRFFDADPRDYEVVFTANASGALKLVGESFPFRPGSRFVLLADNHNSVNGIREFARARQAEVRYVPLDGELRAEGLEEHLGRPRPDAAHLFAYPAQSNFSGVRHPLGWVSRAQGLGYRVLLDAAAFVPTHPLSMTRVAPDFACVSFYKMFGYPTGVGALIARREALAELERPWFGGGTVRFVSAQNQVHLLRVSGEAFEDGTLNYLSMPAVAAGLRFLETVGMERLQTHVMGLTAYLLEGLAALRHTDGSPLVRIYGPRAADGRGATVAFNVLDPRGRQVGHRLVERRAAEQRISLRTGCFCNPGASEYAFHYAQAEAYRCFDEISPAEFTLQQFAACLRDKPVGAVRASLGVPSQLGDVDRLLSFLGAFRDAAAPAPADREVPEVVGV